ncbi:MAG: hypothetical protein QXE31_05575 [Candidatus Woesearchaeota archaeon]
MDDTLLPKDNMEKLKKEIEILKNKPSLDKSEIYRANENDDTKEVMLALSKSMNSLIRIFREASEEMKHDSHDAVLISDKIDKIIERIEKLETQNEKIAKGIIAIADMIEELRQKQFTQNIQRPVPMQPNIQQPLQQMPQPKPLPSYQMPVEEKKKGFSFKI